METRHIDALLTEAASHDLRLQTLINDNTKIFEEYSKALLGLFEAGLDNIFNITPDEFSKLHGLVNKQSIREASIACAVMTGEGAKKLSEKTKKLYRDMPWQTLEGIRNSAAHLERPENQLVIDKVFDGPGFSYPVMKALFCQMLETKLPPYLRPEDKGPLTEVMIGVWAWTIFTAIHAGKFEELINEKMLTTLSENFKSLAEDKKTPNQASPNKDIVTIKDDRKWASRSEAINQKLMPVAYMFVLYQALIHKIVTTGALNEKKTALSEIYISTDSHKQIPWSSIVKLMRNGIAHNNLSQLKQINAVMDDNMVSKLREAEGLFKQKFQNFRLSDWVEEYKQQLTAKLTEPQLAILDQTALRLSQPDMKNVSLKHKTVYLSALANAAADVTEHQFTKLARETEILLNYRPINITPWNFQGSFSRDIEQPAEKMITDIRDYYRRAILIAKQFGLKPLKVSQQQR